MVLSEFTYFLIQACSQQIDKRPCISSSYHLNVAYTSEQHTGQNRRLLLWIYNCRIANETKLSNWETKAVEVFCLVEGKISETFVPNFVQKIKYTRGNER